MVSDRLFDRACNDLQAQTKKVLELEQMNTALRTRVARLEDALPDPDKLEILARWFDMMYPSDTNPEVQTDLREWAKKIRNALEHQYDG